MTVYRLIKTGEMPALRVAKLPIREDDVHDYLSGRYTEPDSGPRTTPRPTSAKTEGTHERARPARRPRARCADRLFLGGLDSGKSTWRAQRPRTRCVSAHGRYLDADVGQKTVGPPATVGMKHIRGPTTSRSSALAEADAIGSVGSTSPQDHLLAAASGALARLRIAPRPRRRPGRRRHRRLVSGITGSSLSTTRSTRSSPTSGRRCSGARSSSRSRGRRPVLRDRRRPPPRPSRRASHSGRGADAQREEAMPATSSAAPAVPRPADRLHAALRRCSISRSSTGCWSASPTATAASPGSATSNTCPTTAVFG